jgi:hypothetical protein
VTLTELNILGRVVTLQHTTTGAIVHLGHAPGLVLGTLDYLPRWDAYASSVDRDPRSLFDQLELLVRSHQMKGRNHEPKPL